MILAADERDTEAIRAELRDALLDFFRDAWERLGDVSGGRWARVVVALVLGVIMSGGFELRRRRRNR